MAHSMHEEKVWEPFLLSHAVRLIFQALFGNLHLPILSPILTIVSYPFQNSLSNQNPALPFHAEEAGQW